MKTKLNRIILGIGSNLGNRLKYIELTKYKLISNKIKINNISGHYESLSWPNPSMPKFINVIIEAFTFLSPFELLKITKMIEHELGRRNSKRNHPRTCDIDIIDYSSDVLNNSKHSLILPHPLMSMRNFVLIPLFEIDKRWKHPESKINIVNLINSLPIKDLRSIKQI